MILYRLMIILGLLITLGICCETCNLRAAKPETYLFPLANPIKVNGKILTTSWYSKWRTENGKSYQYKALNYPAPHGSPIHAPADGEIIKTLVAGYEGAIIEILLDDGVTVTYAHLSRYEILKGRVTRGQVIGYTGQSGRTTGPHLRVRFERNGERFFVNAQTWGMRPDQFEYSQTNFDSARAVFYKDQRAGS